MNIKGITTAGLTGTSMMTLFSYLVSENKDKQFREPVLLSELAHRLLKANTSNNNHLDGWAMHYSVGFAFCTAYDQIWRATKTKPNITSGLVLGGVSGLIGIAVWKTIFSLHPAPPKIEYKRYYFHLFAAHLVFGIGSVLGYRVLKGKNIKD